MKNFLKEKLRIVLSCIAVLLMLSYLYAIIKDCRYCRSWKLPLIYHTVVDAHTVLGLFKPTDFRVDFFGMVYEGKTRNFIDDNVIRYGAFEKPVLFFMRDVAKSIGGDRVIFVDVGANVGQHSLFMSKYTQEVHSFEPYPPVLERFGRMVNINKIKNIFIHPVGLGDKNEKLPFYEPIQSNIGAGGFIRSHETTDIVQELEVVIGDEWLARIGVSKVDIIKLDIEGYEKPALSGLRKTLENNRPIVVMELTPWLDNPVSFKSLEELYATFPRDYKLLCMVSIDLLSGQYKLAHCDDKINLSIHKGKEGAYGVVMYPQEKAIHIQQVVN